MTLNDTITNYNILQLKNAIQQSFRRILGQHGLLL